MKTFYETYIKPYIVPVLLIALSFYAVYCYGGYRATQEIGGDGGRDKIIVEQQKQILANQRDITAKLDGYAKEVAESNRRFALVIGEIAAIRTSLDETASEVQQTAERLRANDALLEESRRLDLEDQRIIRAILERNQGGNKTPEERK